MTLSELIAEVYVQTGRPDLVAETASAVRSVTLAAHSTNEYAPDEVTTVVYAPAGTLNTWQISLAEVSGNNSMYHITGGVSGYHLVEVNGAGHVHTSTPPVRKVVAVYAANDEMELMYEFVRKPPSQVFDAYGLQETGVYRQVGTALSLRLDAPIPAAAITYLAFPDTGASTYNSWIAEVAPFYLVHMAAAAVLGPVCGKVDEANQQRQLAQQHLPVLLEQIRG